MVLSKVALQRKLQRGAGRFNEWEGFLTIVHRKQQLTRGAACNLLQITSTVSISVTNCKIWFPFSSPFFGISHFRSCHHRSFFTFAFHFPP